MKIYWNQGSIPALKGLSKKQREAAKLAVMPQVWKHWQVWLPIVVQVAGFAVFVLAAPRFPHRFPIVMLGILITVTLAQLPLNHYLNYYLERRVRAADNRQPEPASLPGQPI
ncbi:MAG: hypothetical protein JWM59_560 [Verrucomicrobiales bacterium]|nr:hypothetical protein [Verrucomicrobiales bacterium]